MYEFETYNNITDSLVKSFTSKFKTIEKEEVLSECCIFFNGLVERIKSKNLELSEKDICKYVAKGYSRYGYLYLYRILTNRSTSLKIGKTTYEKFITQEKNKNKKFINEDEHNNINDIDLPKMYDNTTNSIELDDLFVDIESEEMFEYNLLLSNIREILNDKEYFIFIKFFLEDATLENIGKKLGVTKEAIRLRIITIRKKLNILKTEYGY